MSLRRRGAITGIGETAYVRGSPRSAFKRQIEASLAAIRDAGLNPKKLDGVIRIGITAVQCAIAAISAGLCRHVLIPSGCNQHARRPAVPGAYRS